LVLGIILYMLNWFLRFKISKLWIVVLLILGLLIVVGVVVLKTGILKKIFEQKPGSCLILTEKNCKKVKIIQLNGAKKAVADLPSGSILFSPIFGQYNNTLVFQSKDGSKKDFGAKLDSDISNIMEDKIYNVIYSKKSERINNSDYSIEKGEQIGIVDKVKLKNYKDYNLVFYVGNIDKKNNFILDNDFLLKMFAKNK
jgi:hypothetical protein